MRSVLGFFSLLALGVLGAGILAVVGSVPLSRFQAGGDYGNGISLDTASLLLGFAAGILLSSLARISWGELPTRAVTWLLANERNFARLAWGLIFVVILVFY